MRATEIAPGIVIACKPVRFLGRIRAQRVIRQLPDGMLESATYPLYAARAQVLAADHPLDCECEVCG